MAKPSRAGPADDQKFQKPKKAKPVQVDTSNLDLDPNAWPKFEKLVKDAAKMGPKPHAQSSATKSRGSKER